MRRLSSILEIFHTKAANLSSETTEKLSTGPNAFVSIVYMECVDVKNECVSFLIPSKTR